MNLFVSNCLTGKWAGVSISFTRVRCSTLIKNFFENLTNRISIFLHRVGNLYRQITRNCKRESYPLTLAYHLEPLVMHTWCPPMTSTARGIAFSPRLELCWKGNSTAPFSVFVEPIIITVRQRLYKRRQ